MAAGKYGTAQSVQDAAPEVSGPHPIWRGIGLILFFLAPVMGYFGAIYLLMENASKRWVALPTDLMVPGRDPLLLIKIILTLAIMFFLMGIFQFLTILIYRLVMPRGSVPLKKPAVVSSDNREKR